MIKSIKKKLEANELQGIANHDANGNMTVMPGLKAKYDAWNRLTEVRDTSDNLMATYEYNGLNQRIKKTANSIVTKSFFNENWQELESVSNNQTTSYVWGLRYIDDLILREKGEERLYSLADPNWNVVALVNTSGTVVERMKYDAFGSVSWLDAAYGAKAASTYNWNRTFTGQVLDMETMLMLYRMRYYNTLIGRWTIRDPIGYRAGDNSLYRYVYNIPIDIIDAYGLQGWEQIFPPGSMDGQFLQAESCQKGIHSRGCGHPPTKLIASSHNCTNDNCTKQCAYLPIKEYGTIQSIFSTPQARCMKRCESLSKAFDRWYDSNRDITWTQSLPKCPCNLKNRCKDIWGEPGPPDGSYHTGATSCIRSITDEILGSANQCCYDANGDLITSGSGQGSADSSAASWTLVGFINFPRHKLNDMTPADNAKDLDGGGWGCYSEAYLNVRPQVKNSGCKGVPTPIK